MANHRVGETGLPDSGRPSTRSLTNNGAIGNTPSATNFLYCDQQGAAYFGELEEALMQGVDGLRETEDRKCRHIFSDLLQSPVSCRFYCDQPRNTRDLPIVANEISANSQCKEYGLPFHLGFYGAYCCCFQQQVNTQSARSTGSGAAQKNSLESDPPNSRKASSDQSTNHKRPQEMMMGSGASRTEAARNPHPTSQEEVLFDWVCQTLSVAQFSQIINF
ncbi:hypothetical protein BHE74_00038946 [Ensete ventricosum]|nr:hypothetical protein BHE74_00038946 [Ensete ventricosum]